MVLAVVGSRNINNRKEIFKSLDKLCYLYEITKIVSGGALGVDSIAIDYAKHKNLQWEEFLPDWSPKPDRPIKMGPRGPYDPTAGHARNQKIIDSADFVVAFWDGISMGTKDSIKKALKQKKLVDTIILK